MKKTFTGGLSFGLTTGVITTLGLMVGLDAATSSKLAVFGGIISIAVADAFSDALGVHTLEETEHVKKARKKVWESTFSTFIAKLFFTLTFLIPMVLFNLQTAVIVNIAWGLLLLTVLSYKIAKSSMEKPYKIIGIHLVFAALVLIATNYIGKLIAAYLS